MTTRRGRNEGSIYKRTYLRKDGSEGMLWCAEVVVGHDLGGKKKRRKLYAPTRAKLVEKLDALKHEVRTGTVTEPTRQRLGEYLTSWLENVARPAVRQSTHLRYGYVLEHAKRLIGGTPLASLSTMQLQALQTELEREGQGARTREMVHRVLNRALKHALRTNIIARNPCAGVQPPRVPVPPMQILDQTQTDKLINAAQADELGALYVVAVQVGLRQGELFALRWEDVDLSAGRLSVKRTLVDLEDHLEVNEPKTGRSRRTVRLPRLALESLGRHRDQAQVKKISSLLVFSDSEGHYLRKSNVLRRSYFPLLERAGLERITFHALRHTAITMQIRAGGACQRV